MGGGGGLVPHVAHDLPGDKGQGSGTAPHGTAPAAHGTGLSGHGRNAARLPG